MGQPLRQHVHKRRRVVTRARDWQQKGDATRRIADEQRPKIKRALLAAIRTFRASIDLDEFKAQLRHGSQLGARRAFPRKRYEDALRKAFEAIATSYEDAGKKGAQQAHNLVLHARRTRHLRKDAPGFGGSYAFDRFTPEVQDALRTMQDAFIQNLSQEAADAVEEALYDGMVEGWTIDEIAAAIRDVIGLNVRQATAVDNYRAGLEGSGMEATEIDALVEAYVESSLDYRAGMIAQTESIRSANLGLHDGYAQAIERGLFPQDAVRRFWQIAADEGVCPICEGIPDANEDGVAVGEEFESDDGPIMDPPVHPNCRCSVTYVTDLDMVDAEEADAEEEAT